MGGVRIVSFQHGLGMAGLSGSLIGLRPPYPYLPDEQLSNLRLLIATDQEQFEQTFPQTLSNIIPSYHDSVAAIHDELSPITPPNQELYVLGLTFINQISKAYVVAALEATGKSGLIIAREIAEALVGEMFIIKHKAKLSKNKDLCIEFLTMVFKKPEPARKEIVQPLGKLIVDYRHSNNLTSGAFSSKAGIGTRNLVNLQNGTFFYGNVKKGNAIEAKAGTLTRVIDVIGDPALQLILAAVSSTK